MSNTKEITETTLLSLMKDYAAYNLWANRQLAEWLGSKPSELLEKEVASSFPSIKGTLFHIYDCQKWWFANLNQLPADFTWGTIFQGSPKEILDLLVKQSEAFYEYAEKLDEEAIQEICSFSIPTVGDFTRTRFEMIHHCMNHSTYHRGQIITIGRNAGITDAPMTDYMFYLLMAKER